MRVSARLTETGIDNLDDLLSALKTPQKQADVAKKTGIPEEYLAVLKREAASDQPKPVDLAEFPGIAEDAVIKLNARGIRNTKQFFEYIKMPTDRAAIAEQTGIPEATILELTKLTDLCRIKWVGANFARLLADSKWDTAEKTAQSDYREVYPVLMQINEEKKYFKGKFGLNDMKLCAIAAKKVPNAIRF